MVEIEAMLPAPKALALPGSNTTATKNTSNNIRQLAIFAFGALFEYGGSNRSFKPGARVFLSSQIGLFQPA